MFCGHCGKEIKDNLKFCTFCGKTTAAIEEKKENIPSIEHTEKQIGSNVKTKTGSVILLSAILLVIIIVFAFNLPPNVKKMVNETQLKSALKSFHFALLNYKNAHNKLNPKNLYELVPTYIKKIPVEPFSKTDKVINSEKLYESVVNGTKNGGWLYIQQTGCVMPYISEKNNNAVEYFNYMSCADYFDLKVFDKKPTIFY